ncbi:hypothetical protein FHU33_1966 [Blastococcus colisei]|uniref:Uncharacterized protein n=1 Tax=Blastococcus colisei TaxID=1564162 RepID=A0A543PEQ1_9ACTN|nr:hypothetical protein [Blastococcus colisei]TQN42562.1 hypothetical protein FHU33_1966 [Blastococcus colisei]
MSTPGDHDDRRQQRGPADPEQRRPRSLRLIASIVGGVVLVVLAVWLIIYLTASETAEYGSESVGAAVASVTAWPVTASVITARPAGPRGHASGHP